VHGRADTVNHGVNSAISYFEASIPVLSQCHCRHDAYVAGTVEALSETSQKPDEIVKRKLYERYGERRIDRDPGLDMGKIFRMAEEEYA
jgi:hypothetical protein